MKLAIILTHNKTDAENIAQIEFLKPLIVKQTVFNDLYNDQGKVIGQFETYYYTIKGLPTDYEVKFYQLLPYGVKEPPNFNDIDSHNVLYRKGDEDKTGDHPRFFNWGLKRGTDYGADIVIHLEDYSKFSIADLPFYLTSLIDPTDKTEFVETNSMKISTLKLLKEIGQLDETKSISQSIVDFKAKIIEKGLING